MLSPDLFDKIILRIFQNPWFLKDLVVNRLWFLDFGTGFDKEISEIVLVISAGRFKKWFFDFWPEFPKSRGCPVVHPFDDLFVSILMIWKHLE